MNFIDYHLHINDLHLDYNDVFKMLHVSDYSQNNPVIAETAHVFAQLENIANIHGGYMVYEKIVIKKDNGIIYIEDKHINPQKKICGYMKEIEKIALFVCTAGEKFSFYSNKYFKEGNYLRGFIIDTFGSLIVEKSVDLFHQNLESKFSEVGLKLTNRYSPGYCDWQVNDQQQLFSLLPENPCNIQLSDSNLMIPIKSISGIIGIGKEVEKREYSCSICKNKTCIYRKVRFSTLDLYGDSTIHNQ
jgi:hypothetical protein